MLTPDYYERLADQLVRLYSELDEAIVSDITRRILKTGQVTDTAKWQIKQAQESGMLYDDVLAEVAKCTDATTNHVRALFQDAGITAIENDNIAYIGAGLSAIIKMSPAAMQTLEAGYKKCLGDLSNLTLTTANTAQEAYITACNNAYMQVTSGAFDYNTAIRNAVKAAAEQGSEVFYPSGHHDKLDVAVRRAVLTGVGQTVRTLSEVNAQDMGCDLMEITAHACARPTHAEWQGQIVSLSGRKGYLSKSDIGYGTGDGFGGWNCRHDWYPFFEGISKRAYTPERLAQLNARDIEYNGKLYTEYEISQMQRAMERDIRKTKRLIVAADTGRSNAEDDALRQGFEDEFTKQSVKLKAKEQKLNAFLKETGSLPDNARLGVLGFGRSEAQKAVWANKKSLTKAINGDTIKKSGGLNPHSKQAAKHAEQYYEAVRRMKTDVKHISQNTGYSEEFIQTIKDFVFNEKHDLGDRYDRFDPSYEMAQTWQRLIDGKNIQPHDLTLLKHEEMERSLMKQGFSQDEAHILTSKKYNYDKEASEYYDKIKKNIKKQ